MTAETEVVAALEKALEDVRKWHKMKAPTVGDQLELLRAQRDSLRDFELACSPLAIRTLLDAHASALRDAEKLREAVSRLLVLARLANWEGDDAAVFGQAALDDNTKGAAE